MDEASAAVVVDARGIVTGWSEDARRLTGHPAGKAVGRAVRALPADACSTSPHPRRAHAYDEGGRGLPLVAQLTQRWGSRRTDGGRTIWAERPLPQP